MIRGAAALGVLAWLVAAGSSCALDGAGAAEQSTAEQQNNASGGPSNTEDGGPEDGGIVEGLELGGSGPAISHQRLANGSPVPVIRGPQGGYHLWLSISASDIPAGPALESLHMAYEVTRSDGELLGRGNAYVPLGSIQGTHATHSGMTMYLDTSKALNLHDEEVAISADLIADPGGTVGTASVRWRASCCTPWDADAGAP